MIPGLEDDACRAFHGLRGKKRGGIGGQAELDAGFGKRFEDDVSERRTAGGKAGDRVHVFFVHNDRPADGVEESLGNFEVFGGGVGTFANASHSGADDGAGVGHGADDGGFFAEALLDVAGGNGGGDGDDERVLIELRLDFLQHFANDLRFYSEQDDVGATNSFSIIGGGSDAEFFSQRDGLLVVADGGGDVFRVEQFLLQIGAKKKATKFGCA